MDTLAKIYEKFAAESVHVGTDKGTIHSYIPEYEELFAPVRTSALSVLEIGVAGGYSMLMWQEYFAQATIHGMDIGNKPTLLNAHPDIQFWKHNSTYYTVLELIGHLTFDIIIDDGSHQFDDQLRTACLLFQLVKPGGLYIVEDMKKPQADLYFKVLGDVELRGEQAPGTNDRLVVVKKG